MTDGKKLMGAGKRLAIAFVASAAIFAGALPLCNHMLNRVVKDDTASKKQLARKISPMKPGPDRYGIDMPGVKRRHYIVFNTCYNVPTEKIAALQREVLQIIDIKSERIFRTHGIGRSRTTVQTVIGFETDDDGTASYYVTSRCYGDCAIKSLTQKDIPFLKPNCCDWRYAFQSENGPCGVRFMRDYRLNH